MKTKPKNDWEEEFREQFPSQRYCPRCGSTRECKHPEEKKWWSYGIYPHSIEDFISDLQKQTSMETLEEVEKLIEQDLDKYHAVEGEIYGRMALVGLRSEIREFKNKE